MYLGVSDCGLRFVCLRLPAPVVKQVCGCVGISELLPRLEPLDRDIVDGGHDGRHLEVDAARGVGLIGDEEASRRLCMCLFVCLCVCARVCASASVRVCVSSVCVRGAPRASGCVPREPS